MSLEEIMNSSRPERFLKIADFLKTRPHPADIEPKIVEQLAFEVSRIHRAGVNTESYNAITPEVSRIMLSMCAYNITALFGEAKPDHTMLASLNESAGKLAIKLARLQQDWIVKHGEYNQAFNYFENAAKFYEALGSEKQRAFIYKFRGDAYSEFSELMRSPARRKDNLVKSAANYLKGAEIFRKEKNESASITYARAGKIEYVLARISHNLPKNEREEIARKTTFHALQALRFNKQGGYDKANLALDIAKASDLLQQITKNQRHCNRTIRYYEKAAEYFRKDPSSRNALGQCERRIGEINESTLQAYPSPK